MLKATGIALLLSFSVHAESYTHIEKYNQFKDKFRVEQAVSNAQKICSINKQAKSITFSDTCLSALNEANAVIKSVKFQSIIDGEKAKLLKVSEMYPNIHFEPASNSFTDK